MSTTIFGVEWRGETLVLIPDKELGEFAYVDLEGQEIISLLKNSSEKNVVMDFYKTKYFGSTALAFFVKLWKIVSGRRGKMAFCNLSEQGKEILEITRLDTLWSICGTREDAMKTVRQG
jgi:anti-anti-sigma factor